MQERIMAPSHLISGGLGGPTARPINTITEAISRLTEAALHAEKVADQLAGASPQQCSTAIGGGNMADSLHNIVDRLEAAISRAARVL